MNRWIAVGVPEGGLNLALRAQAVDPPPKIHRPVNAMVTWDFDMNAHQDMLGRIGSHRPGTT
jgi:hypothetical protein